mmetsp:Transcript_47755/g.139256  ORF Transcript_47755/g.139256 Transcript_47755/m.139256 type:complete len:699 (+) Transcript_47755:2968-5064(+)
MHGAAEGLRVVIAVRSGAVVAACRLAGAAGVARRDVDATHLVGLAQLPRERVLRAAVADNEHRRLGARGRGAHAVAARVAALEPEHKGTATDLGAARCRIVTGEIPVSGVLGHGLVQRIHGVEEDANLGLAVAWRDLLDDLGGDLLHGERLVDAGDVVCEIPAAQGLRELRAASLVHLGEDVPHAALLQQGDRGLERRQVAELGHVDAVNIGVPNLRAAGQHEDALGSEPVQGPQDGVLQRVAPDDGVVECHEHVLAGLDGAVVHVVSMHREVLAGGVLLDECADLGVLVDDLLSADLQLADAAHGLFDLLDIAGAGALAVGLPACEQFLDQACPSTVHFHEGLLVEAVEGQLRGVRDEGQHSVRQRVPLGLQHLHQRQQQEAAQLLALAIDAGVVASGKVDPFEGALLQRLRREHALELPMAAALDDESLARRQGFHHVLADVEHGLDQGRLAGDADDLIVGEVEGRADAARIAENEAVAVAEEAGDTIAAVPIRGCPPQDSRHIDVLRDQAEASPRRLPGSRVLHVQVVILLINEVPDLLQQRYSVGKLAGVLADLDQTCEQILVVGDVKIAGQQQAPRQPIALSEHRVAAVDAVIAVRAVPDMRQKELAGERDVFLDPLRIRALLPVLALGDHGLSWSARDFVGARALRALENVLDGVLVDGLLATDILGARGHVQLHTREAASVLTAVPLLLHH